MKENVPSSPYLIDRHASSAYSITNKLRVQEKSLMNSSLAIDTNRRERMAEFNIDEAIHGRIPRSRSSDSVRRMRRAHDESQRICSHSLLFSATCKLPSVTGSKAMAETQTCTMRPWSRTHDELRKYKELLK